MGISQHDFVRIAALIYQHNSEGLNASDKAELERWLVDDPNLQQLLKELPDSELVRTELDLMNSFDAEVSLLAFRKQHKQKPKFKIWHSVAAIAAAMIFIVAGVYFLKNNNKDVDSLHLAENQNVRPGKNGATLTLANGKKIRLTDATNGEVANEAGISITKAENGQLIYEIASAFDRGVESPLYNTLSTARGETYMIILPDKSKVWLNAASTLTYSTTLNEGGFRKVKLDGEAYFEIYKDKARPFIVEFKGQEVEVLGTHFNISSYPDEEISRTTLVEGAVKISLLSTIDKSKVNTRILSPGQQGVVQSGQMGVVSVNPQEAIAWKNGEFMFNNENLENVMRSIARWYNVEIVYPSKFENTSIWGSVSRFKNISEVLKVIELTGSVHFKVEGRRVYLMN